ncbi:H-NS histone family protein [Pseudogulbenkiania ferrooxidans]|uniref:H-NS histone family protein n=1 Tax=Pseudogulbenkiania ferrooxidans TaxID=549169 RepID=UPI0009DC1942|nr:H-NS histone family protein [Pseudogulbenkiania ferrooxidans]
MRDTNDKSTLELLPVPKKRGRPPTGSAMTNAERQAKHRRECVTVTLNTQEWAEMVDVIRRVCEDSPTAELQALGRKVFSRGIRRPEAMPNVFRVVTENAFLAPASAQLDESVTVTKKRSGSPVYHHPDNELMTWTGRGRTPVWVQQWLQTGKTVYDLPKY